MYHYLASLVQANQSYIYIVCITILLHSYKPISHIYRVCVTILLHSYKPISHIYRVCVTILLHSYQQSVIYIQYVSLSCCTSIRHQSYIYIQYVSLSCTPTGSQSTVCMRRQVVACIVWVIRYQYAGFCESLSCCTPISYRRRPILLVKETHTCAYKRPIHVAKRGTYMLQKETRTCC